MLISFIENFMKSPTCLELCNGKCNWTGGHQFDLIDLYQKAKMLLFVLIKAADFKPAKPKTI